MAVGSSTTKRTLLDLDPDYKDGHVSETKRKCLVEESGQGQAQQRVVEVVVRELDAALAQKENEALQLQEKVQACRRALHILRFGITSEYYKSFCSRVEGQNPMHPAVKRLMGHPMAGIVGCKTRGVRLKSFSEGRPKQSASISSSEGAATVTSVKCTEVKEVRRKPVDKSEKLDERKEKKHNPATKVPRYIPPIMPEPPLVCAASTRMERHRVKRRLVVGNVSKWLPEDIRQDSASHKWMLYVRGPKDSLDVSDFVAKVRYFLHPSYRPHDIVEVVHPFYLSRRGWGEFPVRVQVHFTEPGNRPIDIIHNLKLDRTYSGLQTVGGETVIDVWLKSLQSVESVEDFRVECKQEKGEQKSSTSSLSTVFSDGQHKTVAHDSDELCVIPKKERKEDDEEEECRETGDTIEEKEKEESKEEFHQESKENIQDNHLALIPCKLEPDSENIQVKSEADQIQNNAENMSYIPNQEICSRYTTSSIKEFDLHTLPDHDYLGFNTFKLTRMQCVDQSHSEGSNGNRLLKTQMVQARSGNVNHSSPTVTLPLIEVKNLPQLAHTLPQKQGHPSELKGTFVKPTSRMSTKVNGGASVNRNGIILNTSLVQCVDAEGNLLYISLQTPTSTAKCDIQMGVLVNPLTTQPQKQIGSNHVIGRSADPKIIQYDRSYQKKIAVHSTTSLQPGRSLLKKNVCLVSPISMPSRKPSKMRSIACPRDLVRPKQILPKKCIQPLKLEYGTPDVLLQEAKKVVSEIPDVRQAITWLLRQLPLTDERVDKDPEFKRLHPYCALNKNLFRTWSIGKKLCAERLRANAAHTILQTIDSSRFRKWSVRHIMKWSRLHALTPLHLKPGTQEGHELSAICSSSKLTVSEPAEVQEWLERVAEAAKSAEEMEVNVEELNSCPSDTKAIVHAKETSKGMIWMQSDVSSSGFLRGTVEQLDIGLRPEELCPGVLYPAAEELLNRACQSLCEDLLRRSLRQAWSRSDTMPNEVMLIDVQNALLSRSEFDIFTNTGLGVQAYDASKYL